MEKIMDDSKLIKKYLSGDNRSFELLYKKYEKPLFSYIFRMTNNRENAEEVFQKTWIKVIEKMKSYKEKGKFSSWLFSIGHNCTIDLLRKETRIKEDYIISDDSFTIKEKDKNPEQILVSDENRELLKTAINKLPQEQKDVVLLRIYGDMSFKEISKVLNTPLNTVLGRMHYAVKNLRKGLGGNYS